MRLETLAVSKLMERMVNNGASLEELKKVADYMVTAAVYDEMTVNLYDVAEKNGIKELAKKYPPSFSWMGSSNISAKELLNLNFGVPKHEYDFSKTKVGDKITVDLKELGKFEATAYEVTDNNVLFIFDDYIAERPMNEKPTNEGGYEKSDLKKWIDSYLYSLFPLELKTRIIELTIPTVGQVVGWDDAWDKSYFEPDGDEQLPLMKKRRNRVAYFNNKCEWGWLRNAMKKEYSSASFAHVASYGDAGYGNASNSRGVRPAFRLKK
jgi:hypothetical protein